jgi:long-subunit fatty acid transport protein
VKRALPLVLVLLVAGLWATAAPQKQNTVLVWPGFQESAFPFLPIGGWNVMGTYSVAAAGMGETLLGPNGPAAGFLNPAFLVTIGQPAFSLSARYSWNNYASLGNSILGYQLAGHEDADAFRRGTTYFDQAGLSVPLGRWVIAANYELFQEYNFPTIKSGYGFVAPFAKIDQTGSLRGVNLALARRFGRGFAVGVSFTYLFGSVSRVEVSYPVYILADILSAFLPGGLSGWLESLNLFGLGALDSILPGGEIVQDRHFDLKAPSFTIGMTYEPNARWLFGLVLRPPVDIRINTTLKTSTGMDIGTTGFPLVYETHGRNYMKLPLFAAASVCFRPVPRFQVTGDVSYWAWSEYTTDLSPSGYDQDLGGNVVKLNFGAAYAFELPLDILREITVRAGYIYDPQPYQAGTRFSRNFATVGLGFKIWRVYLDMAAKLGILSPEDQRFRSNQLRAGLSVLF